MCNLYSITTNQAAITALFRVVNRFVGNFAPMPGVFPDYPAPVIRNTDGGTELTMMRWGMPPPLRPRVPIQRTKSIWAPSASARVLPSILERPVRASLTNPAAIPGSVQFERFVQLRKKGLLRR
jgi:putative SOS response-associated peptidase YedK